MKLTIDLSQFDTNAKGTPMPINHRGSRAFILLIGAATSALVVGCSTGGHPMSTSKPTTTNTPTTTTKSAGSGMFSLPDILGGPPSSGTDQSGTPSAINLKAAPGTFAGEWSGHGQKLTLNADGTGTMTLDRDSGADYTLTWAADGPNFTVTLATITATRGGDAPEKAGKIYHATLQADPHGGKTVLHFADNVGDLASIDNGFFWCNTDSSDSDLC